MWEGGLWGRGREGPEGKGRGTAEAGRGHIDSPGTEEQIAFTGAKNGVKPNNQIENGKLFLIP